jgi:hypothetical protein
MAMYWAESHWLAGSSHTLGWASAYNRALMDSLLGAPSGSPPLSIPDWMVVIGVMAIFLPLWRRLHKLGS